MTGSRVGADAVVEQLRRIEHGGGDGVVSLGGRSRLAVTNLDKVYFPDAGYTKGDLMRYYAAAAPVLLPVLRDRPLSMRRFPNGIDGPSFFQQKAPEDPPSGVRVATVATEDDPHAERLVGGSLATLLYLVQLGNIAVDPWHSRVRSLRFADYAILDLDPGERTSFRRVVAVARSVKEELDELGLHGALKTSGSTGVHIFVPLPPRTSYDTSRALAELVATRVVARHPGEATVERSLKSRGESRVYVDFMQNDLGKTVAAAYCVRAKPGGRVSTPLGWDELTDDLDPTAFTIRTVPARREARGDVWAASLRRRNTARQLARIAG